MKALLCENTAGAVQTRTNKKRLVAFINMGLRVSGFTSIKDQMGGKDKTFRDLCGFGLADIIHPLWQIMPTMGGSESLVALRVWIPSLCLWTVPSRYSKTKEPEPEFRLYAFYD